MSICPYVQMSIFYFWGIEEIDVTLLRSSLLAGSLRYSRNREKCNDFRQNCEKICFFRMIFWTFFYDFWGTIDEVTQFLENFY